MPINPGLRRGWFLVRFLAVGCGLNKIGCELNKIGYGLNKIGCEFDSGQGVKVSPDYRHGLKALVVPNIGAARSG